MTPDHKETQVSAFLSSVDSPRKLIFALGLLATLALAILLTSQAAPAASAAGSLPGQGFLPDNRAWEMVSPPGKNGGEVIPNTSYVRVRSDCSSECAVSFASLFGFSDGKGLSGAHAQYVARRTGVDGSNGWSTHSVTPPQETPSIVATGTGANPRYEGTFSPDIDSGVFFSWSPVATVDDPHPNVEAWQNLYLRTDLTASGLGSYELLTQSPVPVPFQLSNYPVFKAGNSGDAEHEGYRTIAFETQRQIADAPTGTQRRLYVYANGSTHVMNQVPTAADPTCGASGPPCSVVASSGYAGGHVQGLNDANQYAEEGRFLSADGSKIYFKAVPGANENVYLRENLDTPSLADDVVVRIQQSEKTVPETARRAFFRIASADGNKALFTTSEGLVDGDDNASIDLYQYEHTSDPANDENLTRISLDVVGPDNPDVVDVVGASESLEHIYFVARGTLAAGQQPLSGNVGGLYHWHSGEVTFVGELETPGSPGVWASNDISINSMSATTLTPGSERVARVAADGTLLFKLTDSDGFVGIGGFEGTDHGDGCYIESDGGPCRELFVYDPTNENLLCASCKPSGAPATADAVAEGQVGTGGNTTRLANLPQSLTDDGRFVFFTSGASLSPDDVNGPCTGSIARTFPRCADVYAFDTSTEQLRLLSSGDGNSPSIFLGASSDGRDVFFATREQLSGWDRDDGYDIYDARVDGGLPEPPADLQPCANASECRGPDADLPVEDVPGSGGIQGTSAPPAADPPDCRRAEERVNKTKGKLKKAKRAANQAQGKWAKRKARRVRKKAAKKAAQADRKLSHCRRGDS